MIKPKRIVELEAIAAAAEKNGELEVAVVLYALCGALSSGSVKKLAMVAGEVARQDLERVRVRLGEIDKDHEVTSIWPETLA